MYELQGRHSKAATAFSGETDISTSEDCCDVPDNDRLTRAEKW